MDGVAPPSKTLAADEHEIARTRTHGKALIVPAVLLILLAGGVGVGLALVPLLDVLPPATQPVLRVVVVALGIVLAVRGCLVPFLRWRTTTYTLTTFRIVARRGILTRVATDLPLNRVQEVSCERGVLDRVLGCGTIRLQTAGDDTPVVLSDVPDVEHLQREIASVLFAPRRADGPDQTPR